MKKITTLEDTLGIIFSHKEDLLENAQMMGFNIDGEWNDLSALQIKKKLSKAILDNPKKVLLQLPEEDLMLLQILKDAEPGIGMAMYSTTHVMAIAMLGLANQCEIKDEYMMEWVCITEDFKEAIRPFVDEVMNDTEVRLRILIEKYLIGALNLYGVLTRAEMKAILKECYDMDDDGSGLFDHVYPNSIALKIQEQEYDKKESIFLSPFIEFFGDVIKERDKRKEITTLKHFDRNTIREAGQMPIPIIPNPISDKLLKTLQKTLGYTEDEAYVWQFRIWQMTQEGEIKDIVQMVMEDAPKGGSIKAINEAMPIISDYLNNAPRWIFRGRCPSDLRVPMTSAPAISLGPNMRAMGYNQEAIQQMVNDMWSSKKVGRNDPCPCGSGKKYKHCCGRNN